jgi:hypothetical protein
LGVAWKVLVDVFFFSRGTISKVSRFSSNTVLDQGSTIASGSRSSSVEVSGLGQTSRGRVTGCCEIIVLGLSEGRGFTTVHVEPPVADEVVLVEDGTVRAEEGVLGEPTIAVLGTDMKDLAFGIGIGVVSWK